MGKWNGLWQCTKVQTPRTPQASRQLHYHRVQTDTDSQTESGGGIFQFEYVKLMMVKQSCAAKPDPNEFTQIASLSLLDRIEVGW